MPYNPKDVLREKLEKSSTAAHTRRRDSYNVQAGKFFAACLLWIVLLAILGRSDQPLLQMIVLLGFPIIGCFWLGRLLFSDPDSLPINPPRESAPSVVPPVPKFNEVGNYQIYPHALAAIHKTRKIIDRRLPVPVDLGLVIYKTETQREIYRVREIPTTAAYIQPFVQIYMPTTMSTVNLCFEIKTGEQRLFSHRQVYDAQDLSLIITPTRLALSPQQIFDQTWELHIKAGDVLLASHPIKWNIGETTTLVGTLSADGEISEELNILMDVEVLEPLSLDELLAESGNETQRQGA
jgi:hypothetical protein